MFNVMNLNNKSNFNDKDAIFLKNIHLSMIILVSFALIVGVLGKVFSGFNGTQSVFLSVCLISFLVGLVVSGLSLRILRANNNK